MRLQLNNSTLPVPWQSSPAPVYRMSILGGSYLRVTDTVFPANGHKTDLSLRNMPWLGKSSESPLTCFRYKKPVNEEALKKSLSDKRWKAANYFSALKRKALRRLRDDGPFAGPTDLFMIHSPRWPYHFNFVPPWPTEEQSSHPTT